MSETILGMSGIVKSYADGEEQRCVLDHVDLSVGAGELVAIVGPSGSGKSTLLNIAGMMLSPDEGDVAICGRAVSHLPQRAWTKLRRKQIGFIFQNHQLLPYLTAEEQLTVILGSDRNATRELFKELGIANAIYKHPAQLSGGERQRVAIARAFATDARLILADEPTASLDSERGRQVVQMIRQEAHQRNKAAVMVTHDQRVLDLVDRVFWMEDGKLIAA